MLYSLKFRSGPISYQPLMSTLVSLQTRSCQSKSECNTSLYFASRGIYVDSRLMNVLSFSSGLSTLATVYKFESPYFANSNLSLSVSRQMTWLIRRLEVLALASLDLSPNTQRLNLKANSLERLKTRLGHTNFLAASASFEIAIFFF